MTRMAGAFRRRAVAAVAAAAAATGMAGTMVAVGHAAAAAAATAAPTPTASAAPSATGTPPRTPGPAPTSTHKPAQPSRPSPLVPQPVMPRPTGTCHPQSTPVSRVTKQPWAQRALAFASVWRLTRGRHVTVAVVDSGVDHTPQLTGRVKAITLTSGFGDCAGHGTAVAGIIAASDLWKEVVPFTGVAPDASILSVKVNQGDKGKTALLAQGIRDAAALGASVINVSVTTGKSPVLASAVKFALSKDAVIVAAAGNDQAAGPGTPAQQGPFYPASYPGVISVGAVTGSGALASFSDRHSHAAVTAPGENLTATWPGGYQTRLQGTSFAAAFVSGVAALVRSRYPQLSAAEVGQRIEATADGGTGPGTGAGLVNPLQAVTAILPSTPTGAASAAPTPAPVSVATAPAPPRLPTAAALSVTGGAITGAAAVAAGAVVISRGRRRRWRPGRAGIPADDSSEHDSS